MVYLAACVSWVMGPAAGDRTNVTAGQNPRPAGKSRLPVVFPDNMDSLCCGQPFASKGYNEQAEHSARN